MPYDVYVYRRRKIRPKKPKPTIPLPKSVPPSLYTTSENSSSTQTSAPPTVQRLRVSLKVFNTFESEKMGFVSV